MKLSSDLKEFIELLNSHKVDYLVVGAHALAWHGLPRYTKDIDFFINPDPDNADIMIEVLNAFGFGEVGFTQGDFIKPDQVIQMGHEPHRIDLLTGLSGVSWDECRATAILGVMDDIPVYYLGVSSYIKNKLASGRPQDLADVSRLREILDHPLMEYPPTLPDSKHEGTIPQQRELP